MDVDAATGEGSVNVHGEGEEDSAEAEEGALAGKNIIHLCRTTLDLSFIAQGLEKVHENPTLENALIYIKIYVDAGKHGGHNCTSKPGADLPRKPTRPHPIILEVG